MNKNKASATRRKNAELRRERSVREHLDKELISNAARAVLTDEAATASEKWQAALLLSNAAGYPPAAFLLVKSGRKRDKIPKANKKFC